MSASGDMEAIKTPESKEWYSIVGTLECQYSMKNPPCRIRAAVRDEIEAALTLLLDEGGTSAELLAVRVAQFKEFAGLDHANPPVPVVVQVGGHLVTAALIIAYPGGTATLLLPHLPAETCGQEVWTQLLSDLVARAAKMEVTILQVLLDPEAAEFWDPYFAAAGLQHC